ncbi:hypothetical protein [Streptomyces sp. NPDC017964]|uniref:hypothetical protein n=1 Tax=Streptomyces sp. NPDC017964 TaxID=3365022 RepID=UPI0037B44235
MAEDAFTVHGISDAMVADASTWNQVDLGAGVGTGGGSREALFVCLDVSEGV